MSRELSLLNKVPNAKSPKSSPWGTHGPQSHQMVLFRLPYAQVSVGELDFEWSPIIYKMLVNEASNPESSPRGTRASPTFRCHHELFPEAPESEYV
jgi:hypothetical protein